MADTPYMFVLRRAGAVLVAVGLIDIAVMVYCIREGISYSSSFNVFAVIGGILLWRGSLGAAAVVRWFAVFMLTGLILFPLAWPFLQPVDLTLTQMRLAPVATTMSAFIYACVVALLAWLQRELAARSVLEARADAGKKARDMRVPVLVGALLVTSLGFFLAFLLNGESAAKARSLAAEQLGGEYRYHVSSMNIMTNSQGTFVSGMVTAWNSREIRVVPVQWRE